MTFLEACNSGKKFRRPCFGKNHYWWVEDGQVVTKHLLSNNVIKVFSSNNDPEEDAELLEDLGKTDWEVLEETITLTKSQFIKAVSETMKEIATEYNDRFIGPMGEQDCPYDINSFKGWASLSKKLGFKE